MLMTKNYLPRHTLLANQATRLGAAVVDVAVLVALFFASFYGCFNLIFSNVYINEGTAKRLNYELASHLAYFDNDSQKVSIYNSDEDYTIYEKAMTYYFFNYLTGENVDIPDGQEYSNYVSPDYQDEIILSDGSKVLPKDYYTISWYNENILSIDDENLDDTKTTTYFTYAKDNEGNYDKTKLGVPKKERYDSKKEAVVEITNYDLAQYYQTLYRSIYVNDFYARSYMSEVINKVNLFQALSFASSMLLAGLINYVLIPFFFKNNETLGKKLFKIGLCSRNGYKMKKYQLLLRFIPYVLTLLFILLFNSSFFVCFIIATVILLCSFATMMASPKKSALHDYVGQTLVYDTKSSIIFEDVLEEEQYLNKEDNIKEVTLRGEEPSISYER